MRALIRLVRLFFVLLMLVTVGLSVAHSQTNYKNKTQFSKIRFDNSGDSIRMSGFVRFNLSKQVLDTLQKGISVYFVLETETTRKRWYWMPESLLKRKRYMRLTYQPLTRRWRLNISDKPLNRSVVGVLLNQNYNSLNEALAVMQRISGWQVLKIKNWNAENKYDVQVKFMLDVSQLRRPMQIGTAGKSGWNLRLNRSFVLDDKSLHTRQ